MAVMKEKDQPLVSVILPTHNRSWCLKTAVDSVLAQDYPNVELIVVDDGSTDDTPKFLQSYKNRFTCLFQENKGVSAARNKGIRASTGELIALLDSDDSWDPRKISCQVNFFMDHSDAVICQTEEIWIRNGKRVNPKHKHKKPSGLIFDQSLHLCLVSPSSVMMRKSLLDNKGLFNESFTVCEDYDLWLRITLDTPVYLIDKPYTLKHGGHKDQLSRMRSQDKFRIESLKELIKSNALTLDQKEKASKVLKKKCLIYGNGCLKRGRDKEARYYFTLAENI